MDTREATRTGLRQSDLGGEARALAKSTVGPPPAAPGLPTDASDGPLPPPPPPHPPPAWDQPNQQRR
eukprot:7591983-Pyramimonas_sp.AAC.1